MLFKTKSLQFASRGSFISVERPEPPRPEAIRSQGSSCDLFSCTDITLLTVTLQDKSSPECHIRMNWTGLNLGQMHERLRDSVSETLSTVLHVLSQKHGSLFSERSCSMLLLFTQMYTMYPVNLVNPNPYRVVSARKSNSQICPLEPRGLGLQWLEQVRVNQPMSGQHSYDWPMIGGGWRTGCCVAMTRTACGWTRGCAALITRWTGVWPGTGSMGTRPTS